MDERRITIVDLSSGAWNPDPTPQEDAQIPLLSYDDAQKHYTYEDFLIVPEALFEAAVKTYQEQFRWSEARAREELLAAYHWHYDDKGAVWYDI